MNKLILPIIIVLIVIGFFGFSRTNKVQEKTSEPAKKEETVSNYKFPGILPDDKIKNKKAVITTSKGVIELDLYADRAPKTVSNFIYLAELGYYNGLNFHRVVPGFVIQGGDPTGTGAGGPGYKFEDEKVVGDYKEGTLAMANAGPNTNGSQFFICLEDLPTLPKLYNLFGQVTSGMDVVKKIQMGDKIESIIIK
ncbi:MAG: peptidylprolyl isomerase [Candidatus Berkelbacteria bacterium]